METHSEKNNPVAERPISDFKRFMRSYTARIIVAGFIMLILLIPMANIGWLIQERKMRQDQVTEELKTEWGDELTYYGLALELRTAATSKKKSKVIYVYPETSSDNINAPVSERYRGIFKANLFTATIASVNRFDLNKILTNPEYKAIDWSRVRVMMVTGRNVRFKELSDFVVNGKAVGVSGQRNDHQLLSYSNYFSLHSNASVEVKSSAEINGSCAVKYKSFASKSEMHLKSDWKDPSFSGALPKNNSFKAKSDGFEASWSNTVQLGNGSRISEDQILVGNSAVSEIKFMTMVDQYQLNERTIKYGILVLVLTFAVFFLIQIIGKTAFHSLHYLMIGLALLLFYSLLLAFSEHLGFNGAYALAASAIILLISWYAKAILNSLKFAMVSGVSLTLLYTFLLVIVNLEIYAMLVGSIGLLVVLAAIMSVTRKMNFEQL